MNEEISLPFAHVRSLTPEALADLVLSRLEPIRERVDPRWKALGMWLSTLPSESLRGLFDATATPGPTTIALRLVKNDNGTLPRSRRKGHEAADVRDRALAIIRERGPVKSMEIRRALGLTEGMVKGLLRRLIEQGAVVSSGDARARTVVFTVAEARAEGQ